MPVQWVNRPDCELPRLLGHDRERQRQAWRAACSCRPRAGRAGSRRIVTYDGDLDRAVAGQSVTLDARGRDRRQPRRRDRRACRAAAGRRPVRGHGGVDGRGADASRPQLPAARGHEHRLGDGLAAQVQGQRRFAGADRGRAAGTQRDRGVRARARSHDRVRSLLGEPRHGRLRADRPDHERHGRRRDAQLRAAPLAQRPLAGDRHRQAGAREAQGPATVSAVADRPFRSGEIDDRQPRREEAPQPRTPHLPAGRRQRPPGPQQGPWVHRRGPGREHPPRGRGGDADGRCRA